MGDTLNAAPPSPAEVYLQLSQLAQWLCPESVDGGRVRIVIELPGPNGWELASELVRPVDTGEVRVVSDPEGDLTQMQSAVLIVLRDEMKVGDIWSTDEVGRRAGYSNTGPLRNWIKLQAPALRLRSTNRGWAKS